MPIDVCLAVIAEVVQEEPPSKEIFKLAYDTYCQHFQGKRSKMELAQFITSMSYFFAENAEVTVVSVPTTKQ